MSSEQAIKELQKIIKDEYGRDVTFDEATTIANDLVGYFDLLAKISHKDRWVENPELPTSV